jgi:hypothetical protein
VLLFALEGQPNDDASDAMLEIVEELKRALLDCLLT